MLDWQAISWPEAELGRALIELAQAAGLQPRATQLPGLANAVELREQTVDNWILMAADVAALHAEPIECRYAELSGVLRDCAPALLRISVSHTRRYLAVLRSTRSKLVLLTPAQTRASLPIALIRQQLVSGLEHAPLAHIDRWLEQAQLGVKRSRRARSAMLELLLADRTIGEVWLLRMDPGGSFVAQLRAGGVIGRVGLAVVFSLIQVALVSTSWVVLGHAALSGVVEFGWLLAWLLANASALPFQIGVSWLGARALTDSAALVKQRLLAGALRMTPDGIRTRGSGRLLAMVTESEALENAGLSGAFGLMLALVQLLGAVVAMSFGAGGWLALALLLVWCAMMLWLALRFWRTRTAWTASRFTLANGFVENVVGNRTRIAQQPQSRWHRVEDRALCDYMSASQRLDAQQLALSVLPGRGWLVLGFVGLVPAVLLQPATASALAIAIGALLQAYAALTAFSLHLSGLTGALVAWRQLSPLYHAAALLPRTGNLSLAVDTQASSAARFEPDAVLLDARGLTFRYRSDAEPVLDDCALVLRHGDRVLLEGPSGGGKSTFASLLTGLREPDRGYVLLRGLDRTSLGDALWHRRVAGAPQFHENHILAGTLAFNLLMGRAWPPSAADRSAADELCQELGLGPLVARMPSGLDQVVGENGWQLSHGERSRVFLARALLQQPDVLILDESFGALDPLTLQTCMTSVRKRAPALVVIAHP